MAAKKPKPAKAAPDASFRVRSAVHADFDFAPPPSLAPGVAHGLREALAAIRFADAKRNAKQIEQLEAIARSAVVRRDERVSGKALQDVERAIAAARKRFADALSGGKGPITAKELGPLEAARDAQIAEALTKLSVTAEDVSPCDDEFRREFDRLVAAPSRSDSSGTPGRKRR
jgi:hypothetical protein